MPVRTASVVFIVCLLACAAQAGPARAYSVIGPWWSDPDVTYNASTARDHAAALYAARAWNRSGVGVRLRRTNGRGDIVVRSTGPGCGGIALLRRRRPLILLGGAARTWPSSWPHTSSVTSSASATSGAGVP